MGKTKSIVATYAEHEIEFRDAFEKGTQLLIDGKVVDTDKKLFSIPFFGSPTKLKGKVEGKDILCTSKNMGVYFDVEIYVDGKLIKSDKYV